MSRMSLIALVALVLSACTATTSGSADPTTGGSASVSPTAVAASPCVAGAGLDEVPALHPSVDGYPQVTVQLRPPDDECAIAMAVRLADDATRRAHGLMEVPDVPEGTGMLFTYPDSPEPRTGGYWMKNTLVPLDIAYLSEDGEVLEIRAMDPCEADPCPSYPPQRPYRAALEVPQGWFAAVGVQPGWQVTIVPA